MEETMKRNKGLMLAAILGFIFIATAALAYPITYTFTGTGTGTWDACPFTNEPFKFTFSGDTINVVSYGGYDEYFGLLGAINVGSNSGGFTQAMSVWTDGLLAVGFGYYPDGPPSPPNMWFGLMLFVDDSVAGYNLRTSFGPLSNATDDMVWLSDIGTTVGDLSITYEHPGANLTFSAQAVPLPPTVLLLGTGLLGLGWRRFRKM
jgi:hypothetical protein